MSFNKTPLALALAALLALGGCGGSDDANVSEDTEEMALEDSGDGYADDGDEAMENEPTVALAAAHLDGLESGLVQENARLQAALDKLAEADTDAGKLLALGEVDIEEIDTEAADAAGLDPEEYAVLKDQLFEVLGAIEMREMVIKDFEGADTSGMDAATAAEAKKNMDEMVAEMPDPFEGMDADLAGALRAKQARLAELRAQNIGLLFKFIGG